MPFTLRIGPTSTATMHSPSYMGMRLWRSINANQTFTTPDGTVLVLDEAIHMFDLSNSLIHSIR